MTDAAVRIARTIATDIDARPDQVGSAISLLDGGATVPFIARYRKEVTGGLDDSQLRTLADRLAYLRELEARRKVILESIKDQGKLTDALARDIQGAETKATLEDLYLPYKPKRRTKATIARENGLEPLLDAILQDRTAEPEALAETYLSEHVTTVKAALDGARDILVERVSEDADLLGRLRAFMQEEAFISSNVIEGKEQAGAKFSDYFSHREKWSSIAPHRILAILRASNEEIVTIGIAPDADTGEPRAIRMVEVAIAIKGSAPGDLWLSKTARWAWSVKLSITMYVDLLGDLRRRAHEEAIAVFARNLKALLLAAPAGPRPTLGLDPGIRTGVKAAVVDATGKLAATDTLYPFQPRNALREAQAAVVAMVVTHKIELIAIGNGTASRETERMVGEALTMLPSGTPRPTSVIVSEAGASVYSASELASREFPDLDVSLRGAVSIARRLQDPLAELVKIEPKSIGVGQYQHDVDQRRLSQALDAVVEDAVNAVGVDLNMASAPLMARVSGLTPTTAQSIVNYRDTEGKFPSRKAVLKVPGLGPKAFEQAAGFLRLSDSKEPLDATAVHPEAYDVARRIVQTCGRDIRAIMRTSDALNRLAPEEFVDDRFGLPTVRDIFAELEKPGRDPRPDFVTARFTEGVEDIKDLRPGMSLEGTVTNVAAFGAFVDIGVHQDGLVHISQLADRFVSDPHDIVKAGDIVKVRVTEVDVARKRIGLSMRKDHRATAPEKASRSDQPHRPPKGNVNSKAKGAKQAKHKNAREKDTPAEDAQSQGALGAALMDAMRRGK